MVSYFKCSNQTIHWQSQVQPVVNNTFVHSETIDLILCTLHWNSFWYLHWSYYIWITTLTEWSTFTCHLSVILYPFAASAAHQDPPSYMLTWEKELQTIITLAAWEKCFILTHKLSIMTQVQEKVFKLITRWHRYPSILRQFATHLKALCSTFGGNAPCFKCSGYESSIFTVRSWWPKYYSFLP